ncbi:HAD hydrolase family protein [Adhaeribacter radiodurans]|uniref:HAD hydrolase family protein n=1 Tax=Adhaeribacter radiodurans TaxID=2745197 RepID=A0A7L7L2T1_9BACT|nr:HAD hydrolase family protein [Adhaeribacter radiodurans]QMU27098.1 HAD hydrolase family protein [Adhaeribacter radiodurans]
MALTEEQKKLIQNFISQPTFRQHGGLLTDLDGTIVLQRNGKFIIPLEVQTGLNKLYQRNCPIILNTIRFPLSIIKTFAAVLYPLAQKPIPVISLNGSQWGYISLGENQEYRFTEAGAQPLKQADIQSCLANIQLLVQQQVPDIAVFYYPRDWTKGEIIWTSVETQVGEIAQSYPSASHVYSSSLAILENHLKAEDISMIFLLVKKDHLAGTFLQRNFQDFYTSTGVNKLTGAHAFVNQLGRTLKQFIGAGDTPMDVFLQETGAVIKVGNLPLDFECSGPLLPIETVPEMGEVFTQIAEACTVTNPSYQL